MKPLNELPSTRPNEDPNTEKRKKEILDFLACGAEFCELEMFDKDKPKTARPQIERGKYERAIRLLAPQTGYGLSYGRKDKGALRLFQRDYKLYCQRIEKPAKEVF
jgi:hypothetical protein